MTGYGFLGLFVFFVISGFCMMASARGVLRRGEPARAFLHRRLRRIYPPLWFSLALSAAIPFLISLIQLRDGPFRLPGDGYIHFTGLIWVRIATLSEIFFTHRAQPGLSFDGINVVYWTLASEVQFYLVMALALCFRRHFAKILWTVTVLGFLSYRIPGMVETGLFFPYWPAFAFGLGLYEALARGYTPRAFFGRATPALAAVVIAGAIATYVLVMGKSYTLGGGLFTFLTALVLWAVSCLDQPFSALRRSARRWVALPVRFIFAAGAMSYTIYLLHAKLSGLVMLLLRDWITPGTVLFALLTVGLTLLACWPFYVYCEKPFISKRAPSAAPPQEDKVLSERQAV